MNAAKQKYNVYLRQIVDDYTGDPALAVKYEDFISSTWAVSAAAAANNVRFRNGDKYNFMIMDHGRAFYHAVLASEDNTQLHEGFCSWAATH